MATVGKVQVALVAGGRAPDVLTYAVPEDWPQEATRGAVVSVPLGRRRVPGIVLGPSEEAAPPGLRDLAAPLGSARIPEDALGLAAWAARYYRAPQALLRRSLLPPDAHTRSRRRVFPCSGSGAPRPATLFRETGTIEEQILARLPSGGLDLDTLRQEFGKRTDPALRRLERGGDVRFEDSSIERREVPRPLRAVAEAQPDLRRARRQADLLAYIRERDPHPISRAEIALRFSGSARLVRTLLDKGAIEEVPEEELKNVAELGPPLRPEQATATTAIESALGTFAPILLFGVTGSGKTEVYLRAARTVRERGQGVLLLVPEIALTPQLVSQATERFPGDVAVVHSGLTDGERARAWEEIATGRLNVVIGPRSAVFSPIQNLGLIVVDEEHDAAYKQEELPRYQGRDVAVMRAKLASCPVVLSSATPSLETWQNAQDGRYQMLRLSSRVNDRPLPAVRLIDLREVGRDRASIRRAAVGVTDEPGPTGREEDRRRGVPLLSPELADALIETYRAGEQSLLFLNRRGWSRFLQCEQCGHVDTCPDCSVSLTFHRGRRAALCHHCGFARPPVVNCPECDSPLESRNFGTEQVEATLHDLLPSARIARLDRDTGTKPGKVQATVNAWRAGDLDVLVGTQMIAKGHDAPGVTLIGVVLADSALHLPDFRAAERTFQLLAQVSGRAGRGERPGRVLVQTRQPDHPSLVFAREHDFEGFAEIECQSRRELTYPPFGRLVRILVEGTPGKAMHYADRVAAHLRQAAGAIEGIAPGDILILGPAPAPLERLRGRERHQILVKARGSRELAHTLSKAALESHSPEGIRTVVDVDPVGML